MSWCPFCVWKRLGEEAQEALKRLPSRLPGPLRNHLVNEELVEFDRLEIGVGAFWRASPRGRAVIRAGESLKDEDDDE